MNPAKDVNDAFVNPADADVARPPRRRVQRTEHWPAERVSVAHRRVEIAILACLGGLGLIALAELGRWWQLTLVLSGWAAHPSAAMPDSNAFDTMSLILAVVFNVLRVSLMILWLVWVYGLARAIQPQERGSSLGWQVAYYLIPVVNLVMPAVAMSRLARAVRQGRWHPDAEWPITRHPTTALVVAWWTAMVAMSAVNIWGQNAARRMETLADAVEVAGSQVALSLVGVAAVALSMILVWQVRAAEPKPGTLVPRHG